jgi:hypothetical protein
MMAVSTIIGVDTARAVDLTVLFRVAQGIGGRPGFWGRYLGTGGRAGATPLTHDEVKFLHEWGIPIVVIYNDTIGGTTNAEGLQDGVKARDLAIALMQPTDTAIFVDVEESFPCTAEYLSGWMQGVLPFRAGCYASWSQPRMQECKQLQLVRWDAHWVAPSGTMPDLAYVDRFYEPDVAPFRQIAGGVMDLYDVDVLYSVGPDRIGAWLPPVVLPPSVQWKLVQARNLVDSVLGPS